MKQNRLNLYLIDMKYIRNLANADDRVMSVSPQIHRETLARKQLTFCQQNQDAIVRKANKLYSLIVSGKASGLLKRRCCDFPKLEKVTEKRTA